MNSSRADHELGKLLEASRCNAIWALAMALHAVWAVAMGHLSRCDGERSVVLRQPVNL